MNNFREKKLRKETLSAARKYYKNVYGTKKKFAPGNRIHYAGRVFDEKEILNLVESALDFWLTAGRFTKKFEHSFSKFLNVKYCSLVNSGSSANLIAFMALTSPKLGKRRILKGDEVITIAAGFPTTIAPIVQYGAVPVFVDITLPTYNIDCSKLKEALSGRTKAIMIAHTLGNPFDLKTIKSFCEKYNLWLIEDNCDSLGSKYKFNGEWKYTGAIGDIATSSFYPPHHITMGEGGAVYTNNIELKRIIDSLRDWGRDCWCAPGRDNTCKRRFTQQFAELPAGYDHKYVYSHFGYNLKITDMQAAIGCAQLKKLPHFIKAREQNWRILFEGLKGLREEFILPEATKDSRPSWFGFLLMPSPKANFNRQNIVDWLERNGIQTRMLFAGNLIKHPCFDEMRNKEQGYRLVGNLENTDAVMQKAFWIGVYPGMSREMVKYTIKIIKDFFIRNVIRN